jgi:hypothetical protein
MAKHVGGTTVFCTVGTTEFDALIEMASSPKILEVRCTLEVFLDLDVIRTTRDAEWRLSFICFSE